MEILDSPPKHQHKWLQALGLQEPPPDLDTWLPVARGIAVENVQAQSSALASRLVAALKDAGIEGHVRLYQFDDTRVGASGMAWGGMVTCAAVVVHNRDLGRAAEIATELERQLEREAQSADDDDDDELTREALQAGPPPEV